VRTSVKGKRKKKTRRLHFTADPSNTDIPVLISDAVHNLRSGLDHLMGALVPERGDSCYFPIYFQGVWESFVPGENQQRIDTRAKWSSDTASLSAEPLAILKLLQPDEAELPGQPQSLLKLINRLSNKDKHRKLPVIATGLAYPFTGEYELPDGTVTPFTGTPERGTVGLEDEAILRKIPYSAVDVKVKGTTLVAIRDSEERFHVALPDVLSNAASLVSDVMNDLSPYVRA
jgi:hypothetical protein